MDTANLIQTVLIYALPVLFAITVHEAAHGYVARYFGRQSGFAAICMASAAGVITPGGPMVSVPLLVVLSNSGMALGPLVAYMTSWSLFGMQRIIAWEAPLMGWHFVAVRVASSFLFPVFAGWLVKLYYHE